MLLKMTPNILQKVALISHMTKQFTFVIPKNHTILLNKKMVTRGFEEKYEKSEKIKSG